PSAAGGQGVCSATRAERAQRYPRPCGNCALKRARRFRMQSAWNERDAAVAVDTGRAMDAELALRLYSTRLLGRDPKLVLHGGGNTSLKGKARDLTGEEVEVLYVKGSGADMATIEPGGFPAVRLAPLRKLRAREAMSDDEMVRVQRALLIDPLAPSPSVETLLHAFVPAKFVDHT